MRVTVLGSAASYAGAGEACAGHLVESGDTRVLFDCGNGVLANLSKIMDPLDIDAIFISHYHPDHYVDLFAYQSLLRYAPDGPAPAIDVYLPEGLPARMKCLLSERGCAELDEAFRFVPLEDGETIEVGEIRVTPVSVEHTEPTFALRAQANGSLLAYTADSSPGEPVSRAVAGADLVLSEATLPEEYTGVAPHMTSTEAGRLARDAGASDLVLVHVWPTNDRNQMEMLASAAFGRPAYVASEFDTFQITSRKGTE